MAAKQTSLVRKKETFVRFILPSMNPDSGSKNGVFDVAYALRREDNLTAREYEELHQVLRWFGDNLSVPTRFNRTKSKGYFRRNTKGIAWFRSSADEHISQMRHLAAILERHGHQVTMIKTSRPGYLVYEDDHQIVAEPFNDIRG